MATLVPDALYAVYDLIDPHLRTEKRGGIANPKSPGYHTSRQDLIRQGRTGDYSIQCPADQRGDARYASGIDLTFGSLSELVTVHKRLRAACTPNAQGGYDPRIECVREVIGTLDGRVVSGYNRVATGNASRSQVGWVSSGYGDDSHLWHEHISVLRDRCDNANAMRGLAEVIAGLPRGALGWITDVVPPPLSTSTYTVKPGDTLTRIAAALGIKDWRAIAALNPGLDPNKIRVGQVLTVPLTDPPPEEKPVLIRVTSTNMQDATLASSQRYPWPKRRPGYIACVKSTDPDVVLVQEATPGQMADLANGLGPSWTWWRAEDTSRDDGPIAVAWHMAVLERTDVAETELPSNRRALGVRLKHEKSGEQFWAVTSHLDNGAAQASTRVDQAEVLADWLPDGPVVFGADLNDKRTGTTGPRSVLRKTGLKFIRDLVDVAGKEWESHHGYGTLTRNGSWISDAGVRGMKVVKAALVRTDRAAPVKAHRNVTDHNMISMEVELS